MNCFFLIYASAPSRKLSVNEVEDLLVVSRRENMAREITGMLVYLPETFLQLIEGPEKEIRQLYQNITRDERHNHVEILKQGFIEKRFFPDWSMGYDEKNIVLRDSKGTFSITDEKVFELFNIIDEGLG